MVRTPGSATPQGQSKLTASSTSQNQTTNQPPGAPNKRKQQYELFPGHPNIAHLPPPPEKYQQLFSTQ